MSCHPTQGYMNSDNQIPGLYQKEDVTPYMHVFAKHVPQFMHQLKEIGLSLQVFSTSSIEKKNHNHVLKNYTYLFIYLKKLQHLLLIYYILFKFVYFLKVLLWVEKLMENQ
jgi:hypothetical protein